METIILADILQSNKQTYIVKFKTQDGHKYI